MAEALAFFAAIFLHELGHLVTAQLFGIPCLALRMTPIGLSLTFDFSHTSYLREAAVHLGGAGFGLLCGISASILLGSAADFFLGITVVLSAVNLLPIAGFDGGAAASCVLSQFFLPDTVWRIGRILSVAAVLALWTAVLWVELRVQANFGLILFVIGMIIGETKGTRQTSPLSSG